MKIKQHTIYRAVIETEEGKLDPVVNATINVNLQRGHKITNIETENGKVFITLEKTEETQ